MDFFLKMLMLGSWLGWCARPHEIDRDPQQHKDQAGPCVVGLVDQEQTFNDGGHHDVDGRQQRIADGLVGPLHRRVCVRRSTKSPAMVRI